MRKQFFGTAMVLTAVLAIAQQRAPSDGVPLHLLVTVEATHGKDVPELQREDVTVFQAKERLPVTGWTAL